MTSDKTDIPAVLGGLPAVTLSHEPSNKWPLLTDEDEKAVLKIMRDGDISTHPVIRELERHTRNSPANPMHSLTTMAPLPY